MAVQKALDEGLRTPDLYVEDQGFTKATTEQLGAAVLRHLN